MSSTQPSADRSGQHSDQYGPPQSQPSQQYGDQHGGYSTASPAYDYPTAQYPNHQSRPVATAPVGRTAPVRGAILALAGLAAAVSPFLDWVDHNNVQANLFTKIETSDLSTYGALGGEVETMIETAIDWVNVGILAAAGFVILTGAAMLIGGICAAVSRGVGRGVGIGAGILAGILAVAVGGAVVFLPADPYEPALGPTLYLIAGAVGLVAAVSIIGRRTARTSG